MYLNKIFIYGNLTRDPELKALPGGTNICNFSVATNRTYTGKDGKKVEQTEFHNVVAFARQAEVIAQYLKKGNTIMVEGRIQTRSWEDKNTKEKKYRTEIMCESMQLGPRTSGGGGGASSGGVPAHRNEEMHDDGPAASSGPGIEYPKDEVNVDDIPF